MLISAGWADTVWLENGDMISGEVIGLDAGILKMNTVYAGELSVNWRHVRSVKTDNPFGSVMPYCLDENGQLN